MGRDRIIACTVALLRSRSPEALTILEVANAAGVNRALVRYYFGDLGGLLHGVTQVLMQRLHDLSQQAMLEQGTLHEQVRKRLVLLSNFMREHPHFDRMALFALDQGARTAAGGSTSLSTITEQGLGLTTQLFQHPADPHANPRFLHLTLLAIATFVSTVPPLLKVLYTDDERSGPVTEDYIDFATAMIVGQIPQGSG